MRNLIIFLTFFFFSFSLLDAQENWELNSLGHFHSVQTNGYRIPNNILLTDYPTLLNGVALNAERGSGSFDFTGIYTTPLGADEDITWTEKEVFLSMMYTRSFGKTSSITTGLSYTSGDVGGNYDFFVVPVVFKETISDDCNLYAKSMLAYYFHRINYEDQQKALIEFGRDFNLGGLKTSLKVNYQFLVGNKFKTNESWVEFGARMKWGELPFYFDFVKSLGVHGGTEDNYALFFGLEFTPYSRN